MPKEINVVELRKHFGKILDEVCADKESCIVTRNGRPMVVLVDFKTYENWKSSPQTETETPPKDPFIEIYSRERIAEFLKQDNPEKKA